MWIWKTVCGMDAAVERTGMYLQRVWKIHIHRLVAVLEVRGKLDTRAAQMRDAVNTSLWA